MAPYGTTDQIDDTMLQAIVTRLEARRRLVPQGGAMTEKEGNAWADALLKDAEAGVFFGACNFYSYVAKRP